MREADQQIENQEIALAQRDLEGLHVQPVACQHAGVIAPLDVAGRAAAARFGGVDDVVMHQGCGVEQLDHRRHLNRAGSCIAVSHQLGRHQQQGRAQPLAAGRLQIAPDGGDRVHGSHRLGGNLLLHLFQVVLDQVENSPRCLGLPQLA